MFASRNNPPEKEYTIVDLRTAPRFGYQVDQKTGKKYVAEVGQTNFYLRMQEQKEETLIYNVIDKYNRGQTDLIGENTGGFIDCIGLPNTLQEIQQSLINAELIFNGLPLEQRGKYGHDIGAFLKDVEDKATAARLAQSAAKREEVKAAAQEPAPEPTGGNV